MIIPQRYKDIRLYLEGLQFANILEDNKTKFTFLSSDKYWCSHLITYKKDHSRVVWTGEDYVQPTVGDSFGVYYMKSKDRVWVKASIPVYSRSELTMMNNIIVDEIRKLGMRQLKIDIPESFSQGKAYVRVLIEDKHNEGDIYNLYNFFKKCQTTPGYLNSF